MANESAPARSLADRTDAFRIPKPQRLGPDSAPRHNPPRQQGPKTPPYRISNAIGWFVDHWYDGDDGHTYKSNWESDGSY
ncbi:hypothetical protein CEE69_04160 [Rhodopirellula bahusiensis]|uniref:Uncharacterized protein n=1 Tax=Rhodopirellula bahusiensis TaxID=2014065 RepID=A0A2G1WC15_9BACT|nr:hypothetical protein CEE69_04160 [Rhodopirellula bahusiensis]